MKMTIRTALAIIIVVAANTSSAKANMKESISQAASHALARYVETVVYGMVENIGELFSDQFRQRTNVNGKVITHTKSQVINFIKKHKHIKQDCITSYAIIEQSATCFIAKVEMKYFEFTRVDYLTVGPEGKKWKVNQVLVTFKENGTSSAK
jgi:hypothetical protein